MVMFVAWPRWVSSRRVVSRSGLLHGCGHCHHAMFCVVGTIIAPCFVLRALLMHGHGGHRVVVAFVVWPRWVLSRCVVSWSGLLRGCGGCHCTMLCRGRDGCVMRRDVAVAVVALHGGVVVTVVAPHVVSQALHHV